MLLTGKWFGVGCTHFDASTWNCDVKLMVGKADGSGSVMECAVRELAVRW
jgi:hypothetical protein